LPPDLQTNRRRQIANAAKYEILRTGLLPAVAVDAYFASKFAIGAAAPATLVEPTPTPTPSQTSTPTPTASPTPTKSPTVKPTVTPTPTKAPTPTPTKAPTATPKPTVTPTKTPTPTPSSTAFYYTVVSGDTLSGIAVRFKRTVSAIRTANKLTSDTIKIGQKLLIP
jgi:LysM repeat protein